MTIVNEAIAMIRAELGISLSPEGIAEIIESLRPHKLADRILELEDGRSITFSRTDGGILISSRTAYLTPEGF